MRQNKRIFWAKCAATFAVLPVLIYAFAEGPDPGYSGVPGELGNCTACHIGTANSGKGGVSVSFPKGLTYAPGVAQQLEVTVQDPDQQRWGFELTARLANDPGSQAGSFAPGADGFTQVKCSSASALPAALPCGDSAPLQYIEHTVAGTRLGTHKSATFAFDWTPPSGGSGNITIYVAGNAANGDFSPTGDHIYTNTYTLTPAAAGGGDKPIITRVENGASFQANNIAPGSFLDVKGSNLASTTEHWDKFIVNGKLPTELPGSRTTVTINGKPGYIAYISPVQINVLAPADTATGNVQVAVTNNGVTSDPASAVMEPFSPALFMWPGSYAVATHPDFTFAVKNGVFPFTTVPAKPGDVIVLWGTGFGPTNPAAPDGEVVPLVTKPSDSLHKMTAMPQITIGGMPAKYLSGVLTPGSAGLYQVAIQVPNLADGDWPVVIQAGGVSSPAGVLLTVQK